MKRPILRYRKENPKLQNLIKIKRISHVKEQGFSRHRAVSLSHIKKPGKVNTGTGTYLPSLTKNDGFFKILFKKKKIKHF